MKTKITFAFLLKDKIHLESQWATYLENSNVLAHCWSAKYRGTIPVNQVKTVLTNWAWTLLAHLELFKEFLKTDDTHICILSESCLPIKSKEELENYVEPDKSYFTGLNFNYRPNDYRQKAYKGIKYFRKMAMHEQWTILSRKHVLILLEHEAQLIKEFGRKFADNEHYSGTYLNNLGYTDELVNAKIHYLTRKGAHPTVYKILTQSQLDRLANEGYFFLRKVDENTRLNGENEMIKPIETEINIQTFAIVHNQDLLLHHDKTFSQLDNFTWLLVSPNPDTSKLSDAGLIENKHYIVCHNLPKNIEEQKELLHYTALYALMENNLLNPTMDYYRFIEYDLVFNNGVSSYVNTCQELLKNNPKQIYCHLQVPHRNCWYRPTYLMELNDKVLKAKFNTNTLTLTKRSGQNNWMCSINFIISKEYLSNFYNYITHNFLEYYKGQKQAGNNLERAFTLYNYQHGIQWGVIPGVSHVFSNSHGTS